MTAAMKITLPPSIALLIAVPLFSACGNSPLLHHVNAKPLVYAPTGANVPAAPSGPSGGTGSPSVGSDAPSAGTDAPSRPAEAECPLAFPKSGLCASLTWDSPASSQAENSFVLRFWSKEGGSPAGPFRDADGTVAVQLWMPSMGHGSSPVTVTPHGGGAYAATRVFFIMPGAWDIRVQIKRGGQLLEQAIQPIQL